MNISPVQYRWQVDNVKPAVVSLVHGQNKRNGSSVYTYILLIRRDTSVRNENGIWAKSLQRYVSDDL